VSNARTSSSPPAARTSRASAASMSSSLRWERSTNSRRNGRIASESSSTTLAPLDEIAHFGRKTHGVERFEEDGECAERRQPLQLRLHDLRSQENHGNPG